MHYDTQIVLTDKSEEFLTKRLLELSIQYSNKLTSKDKEA